MAIVKNKQTSSIDPINDVYIMRPGTFGNPFVLGQDGSREEVIDKFEAWLITGKNFACKEATELRRKLILEKLYTLKGKNLLCCCKPLPCHGDVLLKMLEKLDD